MSKKRQRNAFFFLILPNARSPLNKSAEKQQSFVRGSVLGPQCSGLAQLGEVTTQQKSLGERERERRGTSLPSLHVRTFLSLQTEDINTRAPTPDVMQESEKDPQHTLTSRRPARGRVFLHFQRESASEWAAMMGPRLQRPALSWNLPFLPSSLASPGAEVQAPPLRGEQQVRVDIWTVH